MAKKSKKAEEVVLSPEQIQQDNEITALNQKDLLKRLLEKLSYFDAEMILSAAMLSAGVSKGSEECFKRKEAKDICLQLIKRGGPAFAVGTMVYREYIG